MTSLIYAFYNNKGGVGKTTLCQNAATLYAANHPSTQVIVIDLCPQANISQFLLGGAHSGYATNQRIQALKSRRNIVGFMDWILKGNSGFTSIKNSYAIQVNPHNNKIAENLYLIAGDSFLESLSLALNYAVINPANRHAWKEYMTAIRRLCELEFAEVKNKYTDLRVFIDCNPSFSIYTQMGLTSADRLIVPMMADFSSLEGIRSVLMLLYGHYPSAAQKTYAEDVMTFNSQIAHYQLPLPQLYEFVFNNFTTNTGVAAAFDSVRSELIEFCYNQYLTHGNLFADCGPGILQIDEWEEYFVSDTKDFHTSAKVSASLGIPVHKLPESGKYTMPDGEPVSLPKRNYEDSLKNIVDFVAKIE